MAKERVVTRPVKRSEYEIVFGSSAAARGWSDLNAEAKNALADAWDYLTRHPHQYNADRCYPLRDKLALVSLDGKDLEQWQYKVTDGGRLWYVVQSPSVGNKKVAGRVIVTRAVTGHPNETDSRKNFR